MIASVRGKLLYSDAASVVVECGGVGYKCFVTKNTLYNLPEKNDEVFLYTHLAVREDAMDLYGFGSLDELNAFKLITSVNGVGAKIGIAILSEFSPQRLLLAIASNDAKMLTAASGVGIKLAQRIVLELKDKVGSVEGTDSSAISAVSVARESSSSAEAIEALVSLGYNKSEATLAVSRLDGSLASDQLIKEALKTLARRF